MAIPGISDILLKTAFASSIEPKKAHPSAIYSKDDLFIAAMALYLADFHLLVLKSWQRFSENLQDTAQENNIAHQRHENRKDELKGQRRQAEVFEQDQDSEYIRCGVHRQAGKFRFHQGRHYDEGLDHRHLHIAV